ncbi:MAG TPA: hypothetical protein VK272_10660 [Solirubrobacteraceae bacterium]|nr:hypothetical protein [Solirubrobacteraceae bacterium]
MPEHEPVITQKEPIEAQDDWLEEPEELPRRPRRRLLGVGGNPVALMLLGVLLTACGFIGGVLVEKGQASSSSSSASSSSAAGLASRLRALREGASSAGTSSTGSSSPTGFTRPIAGTVAYLAGSTLYVTTPEGNTVKVTTSAGTSVTRTVKASVKGIHPGETVTVTGPSGSNGVVSAESISFGSNAGGLAALFGGLGAGRGSGGGGASRSEPSLFGNGG